MRIYKFLNKHFALMALRERRFKVSRLTQLNDPFEMFALAVADRTPRFALQMTQFDLNGRAGWACFSRTWKNPVVWAHYADSHRGLCLGFDVPDELTKPIEYVKTREQFPDNLGESDQAAALAVMKRILFTKFDDWRYEDEIRLTVRLDKNDETQDGLQFIDWGETLRLVEVIVGANSPTCKRELEHALVGCEHPVAFIKAAVSIEAFEMTASPDPIRNHDDLMYYIRRGRILHPTEFYREPMPM